MKRGMLWSVTASALLAFVPGCGGGGTGSGGSQSGGSAAANFGCDGNCPSQALAVEEVERILQQGVAASKMAGVASTIAVVDRVGNVLALYQMPGAAATTTIQGKIGAQGGLEGVTVPATLAAISKAGTGAYLSSQGNAFSSRTASQIIQEHFLPGQKNQPGGPLFGVQFSSLPCGDVVVHNPSLAAGGLGGKEKAGGSLGPRPMPLGLSGDPGGLPIYKNGDLVGGIGVEFNGVYTVDRDVFDFDIDTEEEIALAASVGFEAPAERTGDNVFIAGRSLRFADVGYGDVSVFDGSLEPLDTTGLRAEPLYARAEIRAGVPFGTAASGIANTVRAGQPAAVLVNSGGAPRFPSRGGRALPGGVELKPSEVEALLDATLLTAYRLRAAIRTPRDTAARNSIFIVDDRGTALGFIRSQDAPVFSIDVALQKARGAALFSAADAGAKLTQAFVSSGGGFATDYAAAYSAFTGGGALDGSYAFAARSVGNLARPFFIDGIEGRPNGPFSLPFPGTAPGRSWSPFNTGLQLDLIIGGIVAPIVNPGSVPNSCANSSVFGSLGRNGIQIFPGAVPLYRDGVLIGAIGVSGDGIDQDDMIAFFGASRSGLDYAGHTGVGDASLGFNAPAEIRADTIEFPQRDSRVRYVNCPEAPFRGENAQNLCDGL